MDVSKSLTLAVLSAALCAGAGSARAQTAPATAPAAAPVTSTTTTTTVKKGVVVYASGNTLVVKESDGVTRQHTVPDGFTFQMNGKAVTLADLKPGDHITAVITETTTVQDVNVTRVVNATVVESSMGSILVRNAKGQLVKYSSKDVQGKDVKIIMNGKEVALSDLKAGDKLTATIVSNYPPQVSTLRSVDARVTTPTPPAAAAPAPAPAPMVAEAAPPKKAKLPKTASPLPLVGLVGGLFVAAGLGLTLRRRARLAR